MPDDYLESHRLDARYGFNLYDCEYGSTTLLTHSNYHLWRRDMENILDGHGSLNIVLGTLSALEPINSDKISTYQKRYREAASMIRSSCDPLTEVYITGIRNPAEMWNRLKDKLDTASSRMIIYERFAEKRLTTGGDLNEYISELEEYRSLLVGTPHAIRDRMFIAQLLASLPLEYCCTVMELSQEYEVLTLPYVIKALRESGGAPKAVARTVVATKPQPQTTSVRCASVKKPAPSKPSRRNKRCWYCLKRGHWQEECRMKQKADASRDERKRKFLENQKRSG